ncbi:MAG TPA: hypothetical protein VKR82_04900 [Candidatus Acidoferrales bacterium]|nr:hypothetical protein [Candidatus Acidoferrales bacterium]
MANVNRQVTSKHSISAASVGWLTAGVLLSLGAALQLGELGYGPYQPANRWMISMLANGAWHILKLMDGAMLQYILQYWPMLLISFGLGILSLAWSGNRGRAHSGAPSEIGEDHGS